MVPLPRQRQRHILEWLRRDGAVQTRRVAAQLGVSPVTARRDLDALAERGLVRRVHGGALAIERVERSPENPR